VARRKTSPQHEGAEFDARRIVWFGFGLLVSVAVLSAILLAVIRHPYSAQRNAAFTGTDGISAPRLQMKPLDDYTKFHDEKQALLTGSAWIDRNDGTVRIPIDVAMDIVAARATKPTESSK
jgi:hypothetical protein